MCTPEYYMSLALREARKAQHCGEVPIGAVAVSSCGMITHGFNSPIQSRDPSAHAEVCALRAMARLLDNYRLPTCTLFVTLQPCLMCLGLIEHCRVQAVYFGAYEKKYRIPYGTLSRIPLIGPVLEAECSTLLTDFFARMRQAPQDTPFGT